MNDCQCTGPGWCERHQMLKTTALVRMCKTNKKYWDAWESGAGPGRYSAVASAAGTAPAPDGGPGTELTRLLAKVGIKYTENCPCKDRSRIMDAWGTRKCRDSIPQIVVWMREEAQKRGLPFLDIAAKGMILMAIRRAEKKERARKSLSDTASAV